MPVNQTFTAAPLIQTLYALLCSLPDSLTPFCPFASIIFAFSVLSLSSPSCHPHHLSSSFSVPLYPFVVFQFILHLSLQLTQCVIHIQSVSCVSLSCVRPHIPLVFVFFPFLETSNFINREVYLECFLVNWSQIA